MPPLIYPDSSGAQLGTILVHPIPDNTDSQIEGLPGEDITTDDCILVFPAVTGLKSLAWCLPGQSVVIIAVIPRLKV